MQLKSVLLFSKRVLRWMYIFDFFIMPSLHLVEVARKKQLLFKITNYITLKIEDITNCFPVHIVIDVVL